MNVQRDNIMTEGIIDQRQLNSERIANNARMFDLGLLALSSKEQAEVNLFRSFARNAIEEAETITQQAATEADYVTRL